MSTSNDKENLGGTNNEGKSVCDDDVMSPVVTAQERKRRILERRRQERKGAMRRAHSMESRMSLSSGGASSSFSNIGRLTRPRSIPQLNLNGDNDTNDGDVESATNTAFGNDDSILAPPSTFNSMTNTSLFTDLTHPGDNNSKASTAGKPGHPSARPNLTMTRRRLSRRSSGISSRLFSEEEILSNPHATTNQNDSSANNSETGGSITFPLLNQSQLTSSLDTTTNQNHLPTAFASPAKKPSKSLFGAVMQLATLTPGRKASTNAATRELTSNHCVASPPGKTVKSTNATVAASSTMLSTETPTKKQKVSRVSLRDDVIISTPGNRRFNRFSDKVAASPGGFGLLNMLNGVMSPFVSKESPLKKRKHRLLSTTSSAPPTPKTPQIEEVMDATSRNSDSPVATGDRFEEWHEAYLDTAKAQVGVWDWSIKRRLRIECHPGTCLPGRLPINTTIGFGSTNIQSRAMRTFLLGNSITEISSSPSSITDCVVQWDAALMYWQHPAVHPLPHAVLDSGSGSAKSAASRSRSSKRSALSKKRRSKREASSMSSKVTLLNQDGEASAKKGTDIDLLNYIRRQGKGLLGGLGDDDDSASSSNTATPEVLLNHRRREWQQAFQSLYSAWCEKIQELQSQEQAGTPASPEKIAQTYFYSIQKGQVILFRADLTKEGRKDDDTQNSRVMPSIILSSMSQKLRSKLESKGVHLSIFGNTTKEEPKLKDKKKSEEEDEEATLQAELEALRKAQADGVTAGADVSVSVHSFRKGGSLQKKKVHNYYPACIKGEKACAAFFEVYLMSHGSITGSDGKPSSSTTPLVDVPLLVCRKLGPFLHSSLRNLAVTRGRDDAQNASTIELRGPVLPCALHELTCASAAHMMHDFKSQQTNEADEDGETTSTAQKENKVNTSKYHQGKNDDEVDDNDEEDGDSGVSSHYFLLTTQTHEGLESSSSQYVMENGSNGSAWLNVHDPPNNAEAKKSLEDVSGDSSSNDSESHCCEFHECGRSEIMSMAVWDVARPKAIVYKVDPCTNTTT